jgi:hypothetical protein
MKTLLAVGLVLLFAVAASAQMRGYGSNANNHYVNPYQTGQGNYVPGHYQTNPNNTDMDNYSTRGNYNPNSGQTGTRTPRRW